MALPAKQRFKALEVDKVRVELSVSKDPLYTRFKHPSWPLEKELKVMGFSKNEDLIPTDVSMVDTSEMFSSAQYILADKDMNMYEGYIYILDTPNGFVSYLTKLKTNPTS